MISEAYESLKRNYLLLVSREYENRGEENSPKKRSESHCLFYVEKQREEI
jgi:hypothetical protein